MRNLYGTLYYLYPQYEGFTHLSIGTLPMIEVLPLDFEDYMQNGGMPEYVLTINYLKELVDDIIYKDIAAVHNIRNLQV